MLSGFMKFMWTQWWSSEQSTKEDHNDKVDDFDKCMKTKNCFNQYTHLLYF